MSDDLPVSCRCGRLKGVLRDVTPAAGSHIVCYCDDCQAFQRHLGQAGRVLDANGGTDIFQTSPARLAITEGRDQLACLRLTPNGTVRWFARCCNTPVGNTLATGSVPFVGLVTDCLVPDDSARKDRTLGPVTARVFGRHAIGDVSALDVHDKAPLSMMAGFVGKLLARRLRGEHRRSPFFHAETGELVAVPYVLSAEEYRASRPASG